MMLSLLVPPRTFYPPLIPSITKVYEPPVTIYRVCNANVEVKCRGIIEMSIIEVECSKCLVRGWCWEPVAMA